MFLSIIIPLYNEEQLITQLLDELILISFPPYIDQFEIIVVNDHSSDNSQAVLEQYDKFPITFFSLPSNSGKGAAVRYGISQAKGDLFLIQDADLELSPKDIPRMLDAMHDLKVEFINGSRYMPGIIRPLHSYRRYIANRFFSWITSLLINVRITDMACGYKLIHSNLYNKLNLKENRFAFEAELIIKALRVKKNNIAEVPVQYFPRNNGEGKKFKTRDGFYILLKILKYGIFK